MQHCNTDEVWEAFIFGDKKAFAQLYNQYVDTLFRYGNKIANNRDLVLDAIQEVFLELYLTRRKNKILPENLKYYLLLALKRNIIKKLRNKRRFLLSESFNYEYSFEPEYSIERKIIETEHTTSINRRVQDVLKKLPSKQKEALYLRYNESMDYEEISKILNVNIESVRKQVYRALKTIRESLKKESMILWSLFLQQKGIQDPHQPPHIMHITPPERNKFKKK